MYRGKGEREVTRKTTYHAFVITTTVIAGTTAAAPVAIHFGTDLPSTMNTGATAQITISFTDHGLDDWMNVAITNTTPTSIGSSLTAAGLELPSWGSVIGFAPGGVSNYFDTLSYDVSISPGWLSSPNGYDVMITSDGHYEGGNPKGAPKAGETQTVRLNLGNTGMTSDDLEASLASYYASYTGRYATVRFQSVGSNGNMSDMISVPEPATLMLLGLGSLSLLRRRPRMMTGC